MDFEEFCRLARHVEPIYYKIHKFQMKAVFEHYAAPGADTPELVLTPDIFEQLCKDKQIFN